MEYSIKSIFNNFRHPDEILVVLDCDGKIISTSHNELRDNFLNNMPLENINILDLLGKSNQKKFISRLNQMKNGIQVPPTEYKLTNKNNDNTYIEVISMVSSYNDNPAIFALIRDVSIHKLREKKLLDRIVIAEENERKRFARDIHDDLGPFLSGLKLYLDELDNPKIDDNRRKLLIQYLKNMSDETVVKIRSVLNNQMPENLLEKGLVNSLETIIEQFNFTGPVNIQLEISGCSDIIDRSHEYIIYRIIIELINNTIKHSGATAAYIKLISDDSFVRLIFKNNGTGFDLEKSIKSKKGIGLNSIIDRVGLLHGTYKFQNIPDEGIEFEFLFQLK